VRVNEKRGGFQGFHGKGPGDIPTWSWTFVVAEEATCRHHLRTRVRPYSFANMTEILGIARSSTP